MSSYLSTKWSQQLFLIWNTFFKVKQALRTSVLIGFGIQIWFNISKKIKISFKRLNKYYHDVQLLMMPIKFCLCKIH